MKQFLIILFKPVILLWELICALFVTSLIFTIFGIIAYFAYRIYLNGGIAGSM